MNINSQVRLDVTELPTEQFRCQLVVITLLKPGNLFLPHHVETGKRFSERIEPSELELLQLPIELHFNQGIILYGSAPIWLYAHLVDRCRECPWVACYAAPMGKAVVVKSSVAYPQVGDTVPVPLRDVPGIAIAIGGPPDSGKSVLSNALRYTLSRNYPDLQVFLHRANWDGEGNWSYETSDRQIVQTLIERGEYKIHELPNANLLMTSYFDYHAKAVANIRKLVDVVIVDLGGKLQEHKRPVINQCTHYILISSQPEVIPQWHELFGKTLKPLAVLHSKSSNLQLQPNQDFVELKVELAELIQTEQVPDEVFKAILPALDKP